MLTCLVGCAGRFVGVKCVGVVGVLGRLGWVAVMVGLFVVLEWMCWLSVAVMNCPLPDCIVIVPGLSSLWL